MKRFRSLLSIVLITVLLLSAFPLTLGAADGSAGGTYTKKVVSVLYDNSGSMHDTTDWRHEYAYYSIQMLAALLNERDNLIITPLNKNGLVNNSKKNSKEIELDKSDRNNQIKTALEGTFLSPSGGTPYGPMSYAIEHLIDRGMTTSDKMSTDENTEYWLFVMSDGAFTGTSQTEMEAKFADIIKGYNNFQMVYMGMGGNVANLEKPTNSVLAGASNFTGYHVKDVSTVVKTMQSVANQISGRFTANAQLYTISGKKVTVHLSKLDYAVRNLSVMLQSVGSSANISLVSATHQQSTTSVKQPCVISMQTSNGPNLKGYSAVVQANSGYMSGGDLVLEFSDTVNNFSLMVEPALRLNTVIQRKEGGQWVDTDRHYINGNMLPGQEIRALYEVYSEDKNQVVDITKLFGAVVSKVTYAGKEYGVGDPMPLQLGNHEIGILVTADGSYQMYGSFSCIVAAKPDAYRVKGSIASADGGLGQKYNLSFLVYANDVQLTKNDLTAYQYTIIGTDASGADIPVNATVAADGTVTAQVNLEPYAYGNSTFTLRVTDPDGFQREDTVQGQHIPTSVGATVLGTNQLSMTQHAWKQNTQSLTFQANCAGDMVDFTTDFCGYQLTVGGKDVTNDCTVQGEKVIFVPNTDLLSEQLSRVGTVPVEFKVFVKAHPQISHTAQATLTVTPTVFAVYTEQTGGPVSPFEMDRSDAKVRISVERDGQFLTEEELWALYESGELKVAAKGNFLHRIFDKISSYHTVYTTETENGIAYLVATPQQRHGAALALFTTLALFPGDRNVTAEYGTQSAASAFHIDPPDPWSYLWRFLVLLLVIHILMLIMFCKTVTRFKPGTYVSIRVQLDKEGNIKDFYRCPTTPVGKTFFSKLFWKRGYIPFVYWFRGRQVLKVGTYELRAKKNSNPTIFIPRSKKTEGAYISSPMPGNEVYAVIQSKIMAGAPYKKDPAILGQYFAFYETGNFLYSDTTKEKGNKKVHSAATPLRDLSAPIVIPESNNVYTLIFFVSKRK